MNLSVRRLWVRVRESIRWHYLQFRHDWELWKFRKFPKLLEIEIRGHLRNGCFRRTHFFGHIYDDRPKNR